MNAPRSSRGQTIPVVAVALGAVAVVAIAAALFASRPAAPAGGAGATPTPTPAVGSSSPSAPASPAAPAPSSPAQPSGDPSVAPASIVLHSTSGHHVTLDLVDQIGSLRGAVSGHPGDGMSVRWHDSLVEQVGPNAVRITWVAFAEDDRIGLGVNDVDGPLAVVIVQRGPVPYSDALGEDRVVVLTFDRPVDANAIDVQVLDRTID